MKVEILNQGFNLELDKPVGNKVIELIETREIKKITILTAFSSSSIIDKICKYLEIKNIQIDTFRVVTGIDQKGTSKDALKSLLEQELITPRVFYSTSNNIFHPKIYLFENETTTFLIIGSSNFTQQGLFVNIESSVFLEIENTSGDYKIIEDLCNYYTILRSDEDENLYILNDDLIDLLDTKGLLPNKIDVYKDIKKNILEKNSVSSNFKKRELPKLPNFLLNLVKKVKRSSSEKKIVVQEDKPVYVDSSSNRIIWISSSLTERDLNVPKGQNTNVTGEINIDRGGMDKSIDFRHYYRENSFDKLEWKNSLKKRFEHLEEAFANFTILIDGENKGTYNLKLSHNPKTDTTSYLQKNAMTKLKWGDAKSIIANPLLLGKIMSIYSTAEYNKFIIEIK
ncbi:phospholipase D family protein [Empedobacter falsenii]